MRNTAEPASEPVVRFSVSLPPGLVRELDAFVAQGKAANRSQALADMVRRALTAHHAHLGQETVAGVISLVYDHRDRALRDRLAATKHRHYLHIITATVVHLECHSYLEVLLVQGPGRDLQHLSDSLARVRGVKQSTLNLTATKLPPLL